MTPWIVLAAVVAPAVFWIAYFYYHDRFKPEPLSKVALSYLLGAVAGVACWRLYDLLPAIGLPEQPWDLPRGPFLAYAVGVIGFLEELAKLVPFYLFCRRLRVFDEVIDGIVYSSAVALGFASVENLVLLGELSGVELYGRAFASPLVHTVFSSMWGLACARAQLAGRNPLLPTLAGLGAATLAHGVYDFFVTDEVVRPASAALILVLWLWRLRIKHKLRQADPPTNSC